jgi:hypothetical protein
MDESFLLRTPYGDSLPVEVSYLRRGIKAI